MRAAFGEHRERRRQRLALAARSRGEVDAFADRSDFLRLGRIRDFASARIAQPCASNVRPSAVVSPANTSARLAVDVPIQQDLLNWSWTRSISALRRWSCSASRDLPGLGRQDREPLEGLGVSRGIPERVLSVPAAPFRVSP